MKKAFINSLPKSGTHLTAKCLRLMGYRERDHVGSALVLNPGLVSSVRRLAWIPFRQGYQIGVDTPVEVSRRAVHRMLRRAGANSFLTAHVGFSTALLDAVLANDFAPIIVFRDPRAVLVSFVHYVAKRKEHVLHNEFKQLPLVEQFDAVLHGRRFKAAYLEPLRTRCTALDGWITNEHVLQIRFEDLVGAQGGGSDDAQRDTIERICTWLEIPQPPIERLAEELFGPGRHTFRKGQIASWQEELPESLQSEVEQKLGDILSNWGYDNFYATVDLNKASL